MCDFTPFKEPEMVKKRPVVVIGSSLKGRDQLVTVAACSTKVPEPPQKYHYLLPKSSLPQTGYFQKDDTWLKGDMIYTVGFHRLDLIQLGKKDKTTGKRVYFQQVLGPEQMKHIHQCVLHGLGLGLLTDHDYFSIPMALKKT